MTPAEYCRVGMQSEFLYMFYITIAAVWILLVIYSFKNYGTKKTFRYFFPMMVAALFLEAVAVSDGRYFYPGHILYISVLGGSVPLIILLGWSANLFLFLKLSEKIVSRLYRHFNLLRILLISFLTGIIGVCLDMLEDPIAHHNNWWVWTESTVAPSFYGVPLSNFLDWFVILFYMAIATQLIEQSRLSENRKLLISFFSISFIGVAIYATHSLITWFF